MNKPLKMFNGYRRSQVIALNAILCALVLLFVFFPISIGVLSLAIIPVIAIIISAEVLGVFNGMLTGLFFGIVSLIMHLMRPGVLSFAFYNPCVSILPRILIGVIAYYVVVGIIKLFPKIPKIVAYAFGSAAGVITNTVGVLGFIMVFYYGRTLKSGSAISMEWLTGILISNSILEVVFCTIITPPVVLAVNKVLNINQKTTTQK